jgi:hypothetical protein
VSAGDGMATAARPFEPATYLEAIESALDRERNASSERTARLVRECASAHRRGMREGVLLAAFVVLCCGVVLAVFLAAWLNGGSGGAS